MYNRDELSRLICGIIGAIAAMILLLAVIESGLLPLAIGLGIAVFAATLAVSRQWQPALWAGGGVAATIATIGAFNVLAPGWYQNFI